MRWLCAALVAVPLAARADVSVGTSAAPAVELRPADGVIFTARAVRAMGLGYVFGDDARYFTPSVADVRRLERALPNALAKAAATEPALRDALELVLRHLATDKRQYFGVRRKGRRLIHVEGMCAQDAATSPWRTQYVDVDDGYDCFWSVDYDVGSGDFSNTFVHPGA